MAELNNFSLRNYPYVYDADAAFSMNQTVVEMPKIITRYPFTIAGSENYYSPKQRYTDLTNANYKPDSYGFEAYSYSTAEASAILTPDAWNTEIDFSFFSYNNHICNNAGITSPVYVPISFKLFTTTAHLTYYYELAIRPGVLKNPATTSQRYDMSIDLRYRIHDEDNNTDSITNLYSASGIPMYTDQNTFHYIFTPFVYVASDMTENLTIFGGWQAYDNRDSAIAQLGLRYATGNAITQNQHSFYRYEWVKPGTLGSSVSMSWDLATAVMNNPTITPAWDIIEEMPQYGPDASEDGYPKEPVDGHGDNTSDTIDIPAEPEIGVTNVGFVNVYKTGLQSLQDIGVELFPALNYTNPTPISGATTVIESIEAGFNAIVAGLANIPAIIEQQVAATLINYIIDCHVIPVTPTTGSPENIKVGYKTLSATGDRVISDYVTVPCGSIKLGEYYSSFADFLDSTKLFLPFVGFVPARPEWYYSDRLSVTYRFNVIDGSFMAYVQSTGKYTNNGNEGGTVVSQYGGNACIHLPITGVTYSNMVSGLIGAGAGAIAGAASGNIAAAATGALSAASVHGDIPQSNAYSASAAFMSVRRPFLLIERTMTNYSSSYRKENGIPSNITKTLGSVTGFNIIGNIHLDGIDATDTEKAEIERLLREGVIL